MAFFSFIFRLGGEREGWVVEGVKGGEGIREGLKEIQEL